jgi:hypothetical protein
MKNSEKKLELFEITCILPQTNFLVTIRGEGSSSENKIKHSTNPGAPTNN